MNDLSKKVLVPLDGSELSDRILAHVEHLAGKGAEVHLLRVVPSAGIRDPLVIEQRFSDARRHLAERSLLVGSWGAKTHSSITFGDPAEEILSYARSTRPSLIAMSTHGLTGIKKWIRGSTAERVLRECSHPLLLANPFGLKKTKTKPWRRILVPVDGSPRSSAVVPLAHELALASGAELVLFHAAERGKLDEANDVIMTRSEARELLEKQAHLLSGIKARVVVAQGQPAEAILRAIKSEEPDLVAMSSHGRSGIARWMLGSVAENVLRACEIPLLLHRTAKRAEAPTYAEKAHSA